MQVRFKGNFVPTDAVQLRSSRG